MSSLDERIAQFRKMAEAVPDDELAHYRLGQLLQEAKQYEPAIASFQRTLELSPHFSKVYLLIAQCYHAQGKTAEALQTADAGYRVANQRGDNVPREEMGKLITELGGTPPVLPGNTTPATTTPTAPLSGDGFRCQRPTCNYGAHARRLNRPPTSDEEGRRIYDSVCAGCWNDWLRNYSVKVINELRLDLSTDRGQTEYDRYMREFLGFDAPQSPTLPVA